MTKTALITGTSKGLGLKIAEHFLSKGWSVIGISRSKSSINSDNYNHYEIDITDYLTLSISLANINNVDLLINNAALFEMLEFEKTNIDVIDGIIDTNLKGSIYVTKCVLKHMSRGSKIIFVNSVAGLNDLENQSIYCASKHGLRSFASVLGKELRPRGVKVTSIHPGGVNTTLWNEMNPYPLGNSLEAIDPREIAELIYFIADKSNNIDYKSITLFPEIEWH